MEQRVTMSPTFPVSPFPMTEKPISGDEELDEETMNFLSALYTALGPLLPEVSKLKGHQEPPAHLMVDVKAKLRELGSSVSDARKRLLQYNIYLKKRLAKAVEEKKALKELHTEENSEKEFLSELQKFKFPERVHRRSPKIQDPRVASPGENSSRPQREQGEEHPRTYSFPPGTVRTPSRIENFPSRSVSDRLQP